MTSIEPKGLEIPTLSEAGSLPNMYGYVDINPTKLGGVLEVIGIDEARIDQTHIHITNTRLWTLDLRAGLVKGQCVKLIPDITDEQRIQRAGYIRRYIPGINEAEIAKTTFVFLDMAAIAINAWMSVHHAWSKPGLLELEQEICRDASKTLAHELVHVSIPMPLMGSHSTRKIDAAKNREEEIVEARIARIQELRITNGLVNARLRRNYNMEAYRKRFFSMIQR